MRYCERFWESSINTMYSNTMNGFILMIPTKKQVAVNFFVSLPYFVHINLLNTSLVMDWLRITE